MFEKTNTAMYEKTNMVEHSLPHIKRQKPMYEKKNMVVFRIDIKGYLVPRKSRLLLRKRPWCIFMLIKRINSE